MWTKSKWNETIQTKQRKIKLKISNTKNNQTISVIKQIKSDWEKKNKESNKRIQAAKQTQGKQTKKSKHI